MQFTPKRDSLDQYAHICWNIYPLTSWHMLAQRMELETPEQCVKYIQA